MAFSIDHKAPARLQFLFSVRRLSDGRWWTLSSGWSTDATYNLMPEQAPGHYSYWLTHTAKDEVYDVVVRGRAGNNLIKAYRCNSKGKPPQADKKGGKVKATIVGGTLHVDGKAQKAEVVLEEMSSNGVTKYTAIKWGPSGIASCNCPGWTNNAKHKGKDLTARSCKHTKKVAAMTSSSYLVGPILPQQPQSPPATGGTSRTGRGIELD